MQAVILAGGLGTRLRSTISDIPKPMAPIAEKPFLEYLLLGLKEEGISDILLLTGYKSEVIEAYFGDGSAFGLSIRYSRELSPQGTGGAILNAWNDLADEFLLINGDTFFDVQYGLLIDFAREQKHDAVMALRLTDDVARYGFVRYDRDFRVTEFTEKGALPAHQVDGFINGGICYFRKDALAETHTRWKDEAVSLENEIFPALIVQEKLYGLPMGGRFIDIGLPESYAEAQEAIPAWIAKSRKPALFLDRDGVIIRDTNYVFGTDLEFLEDNFLRVRQANRDDLLVLIITNQAGVAKGHFVETDITLTHDHIRETYHGRELIIDDFFYCPYHPEGTVPDYRKLSMCRKPFPGMLLKAAEAHRIDFKRSRMIGDNPNVDRIQLPYLECEIIGNKLAAL